MDDIIVMMNDIKYGYVDIKGDIHNDVDDKFSEFLDKNKKNRKENSFLFLFFTKNHKMQ